MPSLSFARAPALSSVHPEFFISQGPINGLAPDLLGYGCEFDPAGYQDQLFQAAALGLPENLRDAVAKRKAEFFAGRYCAAALLRGLGVCAEVPIANSRAPVWPVGINGAISHSRHQALCVVSTNDDVLVGVDIEHYLTHERVDKLATSIISPQEHAALPASMSLQQALTLCFSAKESAYKAIYPLVGHYVDFLQARIHIDECEPVFSIELSPEIFGGSPGEIHGRFTLDKDYVLTCVSLQKSSFKHVHPGDKKYDIAS